MPYVLRFSQVPEEAFVDIRDYSEKDYKKLSQLEKLGCLIEDKYLKVGSTFAVVDSKEELMKVVKYCSGRDLEKHLKEVQKKRKENEKARVKIEKFCSGKGLIKAEAILAKKFNAVGYENFKTKEECEKVPQQYWGYKNSLTYVYRKSYNSDWIGLWEILKNASN